MVRISLTVASALVIFMVCPAPSATAQTGQGSLRGSVKDEQGGALPGVTVTATSPALIRPETAVTDAEGGYRLINLPPGTYTLAAELSGFANYRREDVLLRAGATFQVDIVMKIGTIQESAAYTIGASSWQAFWHVTLPSIRWGLLYGISLTFARALGEFGALLVVSGGVSGLTETSTLFIFRSLDDRNYVGAYSMAMTLAAISFSILMLMEFFKKRTGEG